MIKITRTCLRPSQDVPWFNESVSKKYIDYVAATYHQTGKLRQEFSVDETGLIKTDIYYWADTSTLEEFKLDPLIQFQHDARVEYDQTNNIEVIYHSIEDL